MARGFVSGVVWGFVVSGAGVVGASLLAGNESRVVLAPVTGPEKTIAEAPVVAPVETGPEAAGAAKDKPDAVAAPADPVIAAEPDTPLEEPEATPEETTPGDETVGASGATMRDEPQAPDVVPVEAVEPAAPVEDVEDQADAGAAETPVAAAGEETGQVAPMATPPAEPEVTAIENPASAPEVPQAMAEDPASEVTPQEEPAPEVAKEDEVAPAAPETGSAEPRIAALPQNTVPAPPEAAATEPQAETPGADATTDPEQTGANIRRLPTIGGPAEPEADTADIDGQPEAEETAKGALDTFAMSFENPDAKPMLSVILIEDPKAPVSDEALAHMPFPLSFAIDATRDDASEAAARYRDAGYEVLLLTNLPKGASASDVAVAFEAYMNAIPEAVAVLDRDATSAEVRLIAGILADHGFGLVTPSKGLNSAQKTAQRNGVPAALVFRELDAANEEVPAIRQYLDRAAFRATQEGSVILLGHTGSETIEALVLWALEGRAASVSIAPVSAVLKGGRSGG